MPMDSVSEENVERLLKEKINKDSELARIQSTTIENMWLNELEELKQMLLNLASKNTKSNTIVIKKVKKNVKVR